MTLESYIDTDGLEHWVDAAINDEIERYIDWDTWLSGQGDSLVNITWTLPSTITEMSAWEVGNIAYIKISCDSVGLHKIICTMDSTDAGKTQKKNKVVYLTVN